MSHRYIIKLEYPVRAKKGEARGPNGRLRQCVIFRGATKEEALADAARWEAAHKADPYGHIIAKGWDAI